MLVRGIFCHDLPIYRDRNGIYCSTTLTDDLFNRYFGVVDELYVATRVYKLDCTYKDAHQEKITLPGIKIIEFPNLNKPQYMFTRIPNAEKQLTKIIKDVDLIFIRGGIIAALASRVCRKLGKPYLAEAAGCAWDEYWNHSFIGKLIAPYMEYQSKKTIREAAFVVYVTEKWLQNRYPTNGEATYASNVILRDIEDAALYKRLKKIEQRSSSDPWVLGTTAGVNNKAKGQQYVIEAMAKLGVQYNIRYELVGTGNTDYLKTIAKKYHVENRVIFKGELSHEEVLQWLDTIDTYIQPSMQEGLPRALIEAMSRGCPAIGSTTAGIPELLTQETIFNRGKVEHLVNVMKSFYKSNWKSLAKINHAKSKEYQIDILNERREILYRKYRQYVVGE